LRQQNSDQVLGLFEVFGDHRADATTAAEGAQ
jgi:hypothetical protein